MKNKESSFCCLLVAFILYIAIASSIIISIFGKNAHAEVSLILPVATAHISHKDRDDYNNENYGLGLSYEIGNNEIGAIYVNKDSNENENIYFYYGRNYKLTRDLTASISLMLPTGYESLAVAPVWSLKYKMVKVSTTYPVGKIINQPSDVVNIQLVIPLKF